MSDVDELVIERGTGDRDLDEVAALVAESFTHPWTREMLADELARNPFARVYVLRIGGRLAGFCACWVVVDELHINTIAVAPELRQRGLGTALMRHILSEAADEGIVRTTLEVRRSNLPAQRLYARLGFTHAGIRAGYYTHPDEDALILWREAPGTNRSGP